MTALLDKTAVVTGASRGIGKAIALRLASEGANVVVTATSVEHLKAIAGEIERLHRQALPLAVNVARYEDAENLVKTAVEKFGQIHILVNNAGITRDNLLVRMREEEWDATMAVNLKGTYHCIRAAAKTFMKQRQGKIINITSVVGIMGNAGQVNYSASKAGIIGLTKSVAKELAARNIQVNAVAPGFIDTDMTRDLSESARDNLKSVIPLGRIGNPEDVAAVVAFLASEDANYVTGQVINVDGGMVM
ncbi:MAG: 3-oxoacyl-[acyl-carrier-protein] reductase [bacterium]